MTMCISKLLSCTKPFSNVSVILFTIVTALVVALTDGENSRRICLSPFKAEEQFSTLEERMIRSHNRFGNFPPNVRTCIRNQATPLYANLLPSQCIDESQLGQTVIDAFGLCIDEITVVQNRVIALRKAGKLAKISSVGRIGFNSSYILVDSVDHDLDSAPSHYDEHALANLSTNSVRFVTLWSQLRHTLTIVWNKFGWQRFGKPLDVNHIGTTDSPAISSRIYSFSCSSGYHWCCAFVGEFQGAGCFPLYCPGLGVRCL